MGISRIKSRQYNTYKQVYFPDPLGIAGKAARDLNLPVRPKPYRAPLAVRGQYFNPLDPLGSLLSLFQGQSPAPPPPPVPEQRAGRNDNVQIDGDCYNSWYVGHDEDDSAKTGDVITPYSQATFKSPGVVYAHLLAYGGDYRTYAEEYVRFGVESGDYEAVLDNPITVTQDMITSAGYLEFAVQWLQGDRQTVIWSNFVNDRGASYYHDDQTRIQFKGTALDGAPYNSWYKGNYQEAGSARPGDVVNPFSRATVKVGGPVHITMQVYGDDGTLITQEDMHVNTQSGQRFEASLANWIAVTQEMADRYNKLIFIVAWGTESGRVLWDNTSGNDQTELSV